MRKSLLYIGIFLVATAISFALWTWTEAGSPWQRDGSLDRWAMKLDEGGICQIDLFNLRPGSIGLSFIADFEGDRATFFYDRTGRFQNVFLPFPLTQNWKVTGEEFFWKPCGKELESLPRGARKKLPQVLFERKTTLPPASTFPDRPTA